MPDRLSWDQYFMKIARMAASRSTCDRAYVGAVIVKDNCVISTGYNGSVKGSKHCSDVGHLLDNGHCVRTIHAELNAILQAAANGVAIKGARMYVTHKPCWECRKAIVNVGIWEVYYSEEVDWKNKTHPLDIGLIPLKEK